MNMEKEKDLLKFEENLKRDIKDIITETLRTEFARYMQLNEMARVGFMGNFDVIVNTDDMGYIPHVHIVDKATRGGQFDTCIRLETNRYFLHGGHKDTLNSKQRKMLNDFMHQPSRNIHYRNNYEHAVNLWNDNNSDSYLQIREDANGNVLMPDYREIENG